MRAAVIGAGFGANHLAWLNACPEIRISALGYKSDKARAAELAAQFGVSEITSDALQLARSGDFDLIVITSPPDTHEELALAALAGGKTVICEKPLAHTLASAQAMAESARRSTATTGVVFQWRENPAFQAARDQAADLGEPRFVDVVFHHDFLADPATPWPWRHDPDQAGSGALGDLGAHAFDLIRWVTGREWTTTSAAAWAPVERRGPGGDPIPAGTDDIVDCGLTAQDGLPGRVLLSRVSAGLRQFAITVVGSRGTLRAQGSPTDGSGFVQRDTGERHEHPPTGMNPYPRLLRGAAIPGFEDGLAVQRLIDQATGLSKEREAWTSEHH